MRHILLVLSLLAAFTAYAPIAAQSPTELAPPTPEPSGDAATTTFNQTGVFEPRDLERISMEIPREGTTYITFQRRFVVTGGSATKNIEMDFTFSSIVLRHSGSTPGNANFTVRIADGRTVFVNVRSLPKTSQDRFAYIR